MSVQRSSQTTLAKTIRSLIKEGIGQFHFSELVEKSKVNQAAAESFILSLFRRKVLKGRLELRCPRCLMVLGEYERFSDIPEENRCEFCACKFPRSSQYVEIICEILEKDFFRGPVKTAC